MRARRTPRLRKAPEADNTVIPSTGTSPRGAGVEGTTTRNLSNTPPRPSNSGHPQPNPRQSSRPPPIPSARPPQYHSQSQPQLPSRPPPSSSNSARSPPGYSPNRPSQVDPRPQQQRQHNANQGQSSRGHGEQTQRRPNLPHPRSAPTRAQAPPGPFRINVEGFPRQPQTLEVMSIFEPYGRLSYIGIYPKSVAVEFESMPEYPFWEQERFIGKIKKRIVDGSPREFEEGQSVHLRCTPARTKEPSWVASPRNPALKFPPSLGVEGTRLSLNVLVQEDVVMEMYTPSTIQASPPRFSINLDTDPESQFIDIEFKEWTLKHGSETSLQPEYILSDNRIRIKLKKCVFSGEYRNSKTHRRILLHLDYPPLFFTRGADEYKSHDADGTFWKNDFDWIRSTDLTLQTDQKELLIQKKLPIGHRKPLGCIDLGKWTTYIIDFDFTGRGPEKQIYEQLKKALFEFGCHIPPYTEHLNIVPRKDLFREDRIVGTGSDLAIMVTEAALPFEVQYQLDVCISEGILHDSNIEPCFIEKLGSLKPDDAVALLERIDDAGERRYDPMSIFDDDLRAIKSKDRSIPGHCVRVRKANITPTTVHLSTPTVEPSNRVLRQYSMQGDRFLRIQFMDEKHEGKLYIHEAKSDRLLDRVAAVFKNGVRIGNLTFEFLAFGNSQFREHGAYFFAPTASVSCEDIRNWMGQVSDIKVIAKYCARLGQCFSTTRAIEIVKGEIEEIKDVQRNGFEFTDGVGLISPFLADLIAIEMKVKKDTFVPSAYQFRLGGCKGVLSVSPRLDHRKVAIRKSQKKFDAGHVGFEINRVADFSSSALNRQLIIILSSLGVPDKVFIKKLNHMLTKLSLAMTDEKVALQQLSKNVDQNGTSLVIAGWVRLGFMRTKEPFVMAMLHLWRAWSIKYLKEKARIIIEDGAFVLGVADDSGPSDEVPGVLQGHMDGTDQDDPKNWPEIFLQISDPEDRTQFRIITGPCVIARNPSLHPGDVRVVNAVDKKELHHHRNVVVFPRNGDRDVPHMLSGGDLDGDDYIIIWDEDLMPEVKNFPPMDYSAPPPKTKEDGIVNVDDMVEFFLDYMRNDRLGTIANSHLAWADESEEGAMSENCQELALLHSKAVDFPKTGVPAELPRRLRVKKYPHFMEKNPRKTRKSTKIVGKLYDLVTKIDFEPMTEANFDERILGAFEDSELAEFESIAREIKDSYDDNMRRTMMQHDVNSEFEIFSGFVLKHSPEKNDYKYHEEIGAAFSLTRDRFTDMMHKKLYEKNSTQDERNAATAQLKESKGKESTMQKTLKDRVTPLEIAKMVATIYKCTRDDVLQWNNMLDDENADDYVPPFISFPWLFAEVLGSIACGDHSEKK